MLRILFLLPLLLLGACARAPANVQTLISDDCGVSYRAIEVGQSVPTGTGNPCFMKVEVPNYPMVGDSVFRGTFASGVRVNVESSYDYTIVDGIKFIDQARFIGKGDANVWDTAESIIIDRRLREIANSPEFLQSEDIIDFNQGEFEDRLLVKLNEYLAEKGVVLNTFTFVVTADEQTRNMIDVAAAIRVCRTIENIDPKVCDDIMISRAGAPTINVTQAPK
jgi:hypothetical protein